MRLPRTSGEQLNDAIPASIHCAIALFTTVIFTHKEAIGLCHVMCLPSLRAAVPGA